MGDSRYFDTLLDEEDMKIDVKLLFGRVCSLIDALEPEEGSFLALEKVERICTESIRSKNKQNMLNGTRATFYSTLSNVTTVEENIITIDPYSSVRFGTILEEDEGVLKLESDTSSNNDNVLIQDSANFTDEVKKTKENNNKGVKSKKKGGKAIEKNIMPKEVISQQKGKTKTAVKKVNDAKQKTKNGSKKEKKGKS